MTDIFFFCPTLALEVRLATGRVWKCKRTPGSFFIQDPKALANTVWELAVNNFPLQSWFRTHLCACLSLASLHTELKGQLSIREHAEEVFRKRFILSNISKGFRRNLTSERSYICSEYRSSGILMHHQSGKWLAHWALLVSSGGRPAPKPSRPQEEIISHVKGKRLFFVWPRT